MILKINMKQFVDTTLNTFSARIASKFNQIEIEQLESESKQTFQLQPQEGGLLLKASSLDAAFQALSWVHHGLTRSLCGKHEALLELRTLKLSLSTLSFDDALSIRELGFNTIIAPNLDDESKSVVKGAQIKLLELIDVNVEEIDEYQTYSEFFLSKIGAAENAILFLPKELFLTADLYDLVVTLSQRVESNVYVAFPFDLSFFEKLELDPYTTTKNLLPVFPSFLTKDICWQRLKSLGCVGSIVECEALPTSADAASFGQTQFFQNWKPANI